MDARGADVSARLAVSWLNTLPCVGALLVERLDDLADGVLLQDRKSVV